MSVVISVILPAHNPDPGRLEQTLDGLRHQTLPAAQWETLLVNNASDRWPDFDHESACLHPPSNLSVLCEPTLGLSAARRRGFAMAKGPLAVLVDDDNILAPDYLEQVLAIFASHPHVGIAGGKVLPRFEVPSPAWASEFHQLLAVRDLGDTVLVSQGLRPAGAVRNQYPPFAPFGAGMALRREAWTAWLEARVMGQPLSDRRGADLASSGDNDIVLCAMRAGWEVAYLPSLNLNHLIPTSRLDARYLARLNRSIQKSWMQVLTLHDANPWPPISATSASLRQLKAWVTYRAWRSPAARIRWQGACGHFEGRMSQPISTDK